jgi:hypothetical protein
MAQDYVLAAPMLRRCEKLFEVSAIICYYSLKRNIFLGRIV